MNCGTFSLMMLMHNSQLVIFMNSHLTLHNALCKCIPELNDLMHHRYTALMANDVPGANEAENTHEAFSGFHFHLNNLVCLCGHLKLLHTLSFYIVFGQGDAQYNI